MKDCNCGYCVGGEPLAKFGIKSVIWTLAS